MKDITIGSVLWDRYECVKQLKQHGMNHVYELKDLRVNKQRRIMKVSGGEEYVQQVNQEVSILTTISHSAIPKVMDYGYCATSQSVWIIYDFIEGQTLEEWVTSQEHITYQQLLHIAEQLVNICHDLHNQPIPVLHRDIKPSNIIINERGVVYLIDFGIATRLAREEIVDTTFWGTAGFAAPEQYPDSPEKKYTILQTKVDVYGVGAVLDWILTTIYKRLQATSFVRKGQKLRQIPDSLYQLVEDLLVSDKQYRLPSMAVVYERIMQLRAKIDVEMTDKKSEYSNIPFTIVVASLNRGAGATFVSQLLAELLVRKQKVSILEAGADETETQWMSGNYKHDESSFIDQPLYQLFVGKQLPIKYYVKLNRLFDQYKEQLIAEELQQQMAISTIAASERSVLIVDISSRLHDHLWRYWIDQANHLIVVGDPFLATWSHQTLTTYASLKRSELKVSFIANKWITFGFEQQWLSYFPNKVIAKLPYIELEKRLQYTWSSQWITSDVMIRKKWRKLLQPLLKRLQNEHNTS